MGSMSDIRAMVMGFSAVVEDMKASGEIEKGTDALAEILKSVKESLVKKGFTDSEAIKIVCSMNPGSK